MSKQNQFTSIADAMQFAIRCDIAGVGGGIMPIDDTNNFHNDQSGIYLPPWAEADNAPEPQWGEKRQFMIRFKQKSNDGTPVAGMNVGLFVADAERYAVFEGGGAGPGAPLNWNHAVEFAKAQVAARLAEMNGPQS